MYKLRWIWYLPEGVYLPEGIFPGCSGEILPEGWHLITTGDVRKVIGNMCEFTVGKHVAVSSL